MEEANRVAAEFLQRYPDSPVALAESAIMTATLKSAAEALPLLERALAASGKEVNPRVYLAMGLLAEALASEGHIIAARHCATFQLSIDKHDRQPIDLLLNLNASSSIPTFFKEMRPLCPAPDGEPWKASFDEAIALGGAFQSCAAAEKMALLAKQYPEVPMIWWSLGVLRAWAADEKGAAEALHTMASLPGPVEDRAEAEAFALLLSEDPLGDNLNILSLQYTIRDFEAVQTALLSSPRISPAAIDLSELAADGQPPPKGAFYLLDRAVPLTHTGIVAETIPCILCSLLLFGRQTDREARLEVEGVSAADLEGVKEQIAEIVDGSLEPPTETVKWRESATRRSLARYWRLPRDADEDRVCELSQQYLEKALLDRFVLQPLPYLDGKSPEEAARDEAYHVKVLAALHLLDFWMEEFGARFDNGRLRGRLGLPEAEPIDPAAVPVESIPLVRLSRVMIDRLSEEDLVRLWDTALAFRIRTAIWRLGRELVARPGVGKFQTRWSAFYMLARMAETWDEAREYVEKGRQEAKAAGISCAPWDLFELARWISRGEGEPAARLIEHLRSQHGRESRAMNALLDMLARFGLLRPDGTVALPMSQKPTIVVPGQETGGQAKIYLPDGSQPHTAKPSIWRPEAD